MWPDPSLSSNASQLVGRKRLRPIVLGFIKVAQRYFLQSPNGSFLLCYISFVLFLWCVYWGELGSEVRGHLHLGSGEPSPTSGGEKLSTHYFPASNTIHYYPTNYPPTTFQPLLSNQLSQCSHPARGEPPIKGTPSPHIQPLLLHIFSFWTNSPEGYNLFHILSLQMSQIIQVGRPLEKRRYSFSVQISLSLRYLLATKLGISLFVGCLGSYFVKSLKLSGILCLLRCLCKFRHAKSVRMSKNVLSASSKKMGKYAYD